MTETQQDIKQLIAIQKARAEAKAAKEPSPAAEPTPVAEPTPAAEPGSAAQERRPLTLVPYTIVKSLASLDNIYETRLFGWTLAKAQSVLKLYNKDLTEINIEHALGLTRVTIPARFVLTEGDKNYSQVTKAFSLATKKIEYTKDNKLYHLNIIAFPTLVKDGRRSIISFVIHNELWHALLDFSKGYRLFNLSTFMQLQSKYSVIMYLLCTQQSKPKTYGIEALKQLLGCDCNKAYERGANFFARVIDPAREELKMKAPWYFEYSATKEGKRHKYVEVIITPVLNKTVALGLTEVEKKADELRVGLDEEVMRYCIDNFGMSARDVERIEPLIRRLGAMDKQLEKLSEIKMRTRTSRVRKPAGYLVRSLQNLAR